MARPPTRQRPDPSSPVPYIDGICLINTRHFDDNVLSRLYEAWKVDCQRPQILVNTVVAIAEKQVVTIFARTKTEVGCVVSRQSNLQRVVRSEALFGYSLVGVFVFLGAIGVLHHAMWRDEVYTWLMARFSNSLRDEYLLARYDPHFMLWHVVLWILTRFTHNCQSMQWLHLALATASVWVLVRLGPFTRVQKALYCFGYFTIFEYCLIAREYVCIVLLLFSLCVVRDRRKNSFVAQAIILFLLSNINALATIIAFSFAAASVLEHIRRRDVGALWATRKRAVILSAVILCAALIGDAFQLRHPKDAAAFQHWPRPMTVSSFAAALGDLWRGYVPIPRPFLAQLGGIRRQVWLGHSRSPGHSFIG